MKQNSSVVIKLLWLTFFALVGLFVCACIQALLGDTTTNLETTRWMLLLQTVTTFAIPAIVFGSIYGQKEQTVPCRNRCVWLLVVALMPCALPAVNLTKWINDMLVLPHFMSSIEQWMQHMETATNELTMKLLTTDNFGGIAVNLLIMALAPAIAEELFFRGALQKTLAQSMNAHAAIWLTAVIFSAVHLQFYGFVPRMLLGAALGYLFWLTGSIWTSVTAHFVNNALTIVLFNADLTFDIDSVGTGQTWWIGLLSLIVSFGIIWAVAHLAAPKKK